MFLTGLVGAALAGQREWSTHLPCAARRKLAARCQQQPRCGVRGSLPFPGKSPHSPGGAAGGPCLPLQPPCTSTLICGRRALPLQGALSSRGPVLAPTNCVHPLPPSSFHQNDLTLFVVASPKVAHTEASGRAREPLTLCPANEARLPACNSPALGTRNPICPIPSQERFAYWVRQVLPAT